MIFVQKQAQTQKHDVVMMMMIMRALTPTIAHCGPKILWNQKQMKKKHHHDKLVSSTMYSTHSIAYDCVMGGVPFKERTLAFEPTLSHQWRSIEHRNTSIHIIFWSSLLFHSFSPWNEWNLWDSKYMCEELTTTITTTTSSASHHHYHHFSCGCATIKPKLPKSL